MAKKVLIVDDHPIVRQGIVSLLSHDKSLEVCGEAESAPEALDVLRERKPDVAIIDISLKGADGLELTKSIRAFDEKIPILIMSMHDEALYAERVLKAGANGYIMKQVVAERIIEAVQRVLRGDIYVSSEVQRRILMGLRGGAQSEEQSPVDRLSDRELEVFRLIGSGLGTRQIADQLHLSVKTIETYRAHIKVKLNIDNAPELMRYAVQWIEQDGTPLS